MEEVDPIQPEAVAMDATDEEDVAVQDTVPKGLLSLKRMISH